MPRNKNGKPIDPADMNRADGFSPGSAMLTKVPGLDSPAAVKRSKLPPLTNLRRGLAKSSPVVLINARTGQAASDLGRDRLKRQEARRTAC